ncbi:MAG TPA: protein-disulfide reductase DsbD domain-containing protein [Candidatus Acidoferrales bacterium]
MTLAACSFFLGAAVAGQEPEAPKTASVVKAQSFVSVDPVARGKEFQVALNLEIARGFHMNSHHPSDAYLIPTNLTPQTPTGFEVLDTIYPAGHLQKFAFSPDKPLDVYSGSVTLKLKMRASADAPLGPMTIPMVLRYQACNDSTCLPPNKLPVEFKFVVGAATAKSRAVHPELFTPQASAK